MTVEEKYHGRGNPSEAHQSTLFPRDPYITDDGDDEPECSKEELEDAIHDTFKAVELIEYWRDYKSVEQLEAIDAVLGHLLIEKHGEAAFIIALQCLPTPPPHTSWFHVPFDKPDIDHK